MSCANAAGRQPTALVVVATAAALLAGCAAVGPDYAGPPAVATGALQATGFVRAGPADAAGAAQAPPPARWWDAVGDAQLAALVDEALAASPNLKAAAARVRSAREREALGRAGLLPAGSLGARYVRGRIPTGSFTPGGSAGSDAAGAGASTSSLADPIRIDTYSASFDASWEIDLFGARRRGIESASATLQATQAAYEDAQVQLASEVGVAYARLRAAQQRLALQTRATELRSRSLALTRQRRDGGTASQVDLDRLQTELTQARAGVPPLQAEVEQQLDRLALLAGREPGALDARLALAPAQGSVQPMPPRQVPLGTPAEWLRRRPDIRQAERTLAARNATIGQNVAAYFPSVSVLGLAASSAPRLADLFSGSPLWLLSPALSWNFLGAPGTGARVRGAEADRDEALAAYENTVLAALQDANASLSRLAHGRQALLDSEAARDAAVDADRLTRQRYAAGTASLIDALDTERQRMQLEDQLAQARSALMVDYVSLQKSLGLGWAAAADRR
jgi:NodT family efflux transporter outer membrane factor (OMF) lipoprotein